MKYKDECQKNAKIALDSIGMLKYSDETNLQKWADHYYTSQYERILQDIEICISLCKLNNSKILDVGSAPFFSTVALAKLQYNIVGADIAPERFSPFLGSYGVHVEKCNIETQDLPFPNNSFDLVLFGEVFEHLRIDLIFTMSEIHRVLKPGGVLFLSTPNLFEFGKIMNFLLRGKTIPIFDEYNKLRTVGHMGHIREYTVRDVVDFLSKIGFSQKKLIFRGKAKWSLKPFFLLRACMHRIVPSSRFWFSLILTKN